MRAYTVNVPERFPDVGSDTAARMLKAALAERVELAPDAIGSGPKVLRLTVDEGDAEALQLLSGGGSMASAFRSLFSTAAGIRAAPRLGRESRALPAAKAVEMLPPQATHPRALPPAPKAELVPSRASESRKDARGMPGGWQVVPWGFVGWQAGASPSVPSKAAIGSRAEVKRKEWLYLALGILVVVLYYAALIFFGTRSGGSGSASPGPRYAAWRPS